MVGTGIRTSAASGRLESTPIASGIWRTHSCHAAESRPTSRERRKSFHSSTRTCWTSMIPAMMPSQRPATVKNVQNVIGVGEAQLPANASPLAMSTPIAMASRMSHTRVITTRTDCTLPVIWWPSRLSAITGSSTT
jgi:hypothetical protein